MAQQQHAKKQGFMPPLVRNVFVCLKRAEVTIQVS